MVSVQDGFDFMKKVFKKDIASGFKKKVVVQYNIQGEGGGKWQTILENGAYKIVKGGTEKANVELTYDSVESFVKITKGEIDGIQAYTMGKLKFQGPQALLQQYGRIFPAK